MSAPNREIDLLIPITVMILMEKVAIKASFHHREVGMAASIVGARGISHGGKERSGLDST
jgi:hypothetical protein